MTLTKGRWEHKKSHQNQIPLPLRHNDLVNLMRNIRPTFSSRINSNILIYVHMYMYFYLDHTDNNEHRLKNGCNNVVFN